MGSGSRRTMVGEETVVVTVETGPTKHEHALDTRDAG